MTIRTTRPIRRRIEAEHRHRGLPKIPPTAEINEMNRELAFPDGNDRGWRGIQVSKETVQAAKNIAGG